MDGLGRGIAENRSPASIFATARAKIGPTVSRGFNQPHPGPIGMLDFQPQIAVPRMLDSH